MPDRLQARGRGHGERRDRGRATGGAAPGGGGGGGGGEEQYAYCAFFRGGRAVASMTVRRRRQHPSDFGLASTFVETICLEELAEPSVRFLRAIAYYGLVELEYKHDP